MTTPPSLSEAEIRELQRRVATLDPCPISAVEIRSLLHSAARAQLLERFIDEHAATIESWLCPSNGENASEDDRASVACLEALRSLRGKR